MVNHRYNVTSQSSVRSKSIVQLKGVELIWGALSARTWQTTLSAFGSAFVSHHGASLRLCDAFMEIGGASAWLQAATFVHFLFLLNCVFFILARECFHVPLYVDTSC